MIFFFFFFFLVKTKEKWIQTLFKMLPTTLLESMRAATQQRPRVVVKHHLLEDLKKNKLFIKVKNRKVVEELLESKYLNEIYLTIAVYK